MLSTVPQSISLMPEMLIFFGGGFDWAVSLGWSFEKYTAQFQFCWLIGVIIGAFLGGPLLYFIRSRHLLHLACVLSITGGIVTVSDYDNLSALIAARYLNGAAVGLTTVEFIVRASEIAAAKNRAFALGWEQFGFYNGAFVQIIYTVLWSTSLGFSADCLRGIFCLVFAVLALVMSYFHTESPIYYLLRGNDHDALICVDKLYWPRGKSDEKQLVLEEMRVYFVDNGSRPLGESVMQSQPPLLKIALYRAMMAFISALPLGDALLHVAPAVLPDESVNWTPILFGGLPFIGIFLARTTYDMVGCKIISLPSLLIAGACTIAVGAIFDAMDGGSGNYQQALAVLILLMIAQFFGSVYVVSTTIYVGEAFPLQCKAYFVSICVIVQYVVELVIVLTFVNTDYYTFAYCVATGVIMCVLAVFFMVTVPTTKNMTLLEVERRFNKWSNYRAY